MLTACVILVAMMINILSVKLSNSVTRVFFYAKLIALFIVIIAGFVQLGKGKTTNFSNAFEGSSTVWTSYSVALYSGMWSFDGWNQLAYVTEELKNPARNFPIAVWFAIPLVAVVYVCANIAYLTVMTPSEIIDSDAVAVTFAYRALGKWAWIVPVGVVCSTFGTANGSMFTAGRMANVASRRSHLPKVMSYIDTVHYTPSLAIMFNAFMAILFLIPDASNFSTVLDYLSFTTWIFYGTSCFAVVILRYKEPYASKKRDYKVPIILPIFCGLASLYLVVAPVIQNPNMGYVYVTALLAASAIFYIPIHVMKVNWIDGPMDKLTLLLQKVLQLAPSD